jgi:hypothetical protein
MWTTRGPSHYNCHVELLSQYPKYYAIGSSSTFATLAAKALVFAWLWGPTSVQEKV